LRVPARIAAAKHVASFFPRPAACFGLIVSLAAVAEAAAAPELAGAAASAAGAAVEIVDVGSVAGAVSVDGAALAPAGVGVAATSPPLTPERGASLTQAVRAASERTPRRVERT
jgi:hypothetical protein